LARGAGIDVGGGPDGSGTVESNVDVHCGCQ
jgi:hypothetical protein